MKKIVVLVSGQGSNLQALIDAQQQGRISGEISAVFSNNPDAYGLKRAELAGIAHHALDAKAYADRASFDLALAQAIDQYQPDLLVLAGYMRILSPEFVQHYAGRMLNIHPSLLPKYPGLHTHRQVLENGDQEHGTSVHFVTEELDGGPVILQAKVPIFSDDSEADIISRVQTQEHSIYPLVVGWFTDGRLAMRDNTAWLDDKRLPAQGYAAE
ncbi:phosphoribosylglycinamide formyltransferase [Yersinia enterocolitica]|uniref:phosphoribosylglycinamide formyltransferase n=1 Tax=Yersinia enterocolitica TaxID=630 RepID=UPI0021E6ED02|nr:phosphoribosylglycinamide formyltransferase [Yersinia enterocolitica]EKN3889014.1 phosphoribosylglycinamide formyltransferase [Yersinia enterocolitica]EKN5061570.1 phosphoribosylglycinamide formyltransferase [Yersinia enterocolitica]ELW9025940.1 phosphoribosylglycinamide formyltransferase [Yersinia enterocolitica]UYK00691.1 phosphoribosylglycinamide formyltransferase [Yersinia enterocolitica]HDL7656310.1 phosphoribosylglycinamide formyltransferase [Yersinia enterocolitica]